MLACDRGSRQQDMESLKVSFSFLKMESQREGGHKKKERERDRMVGTSGETRLVPNSVTT